MSLHLTFNLSCDGNLTLADGSSVTAECRYHRYEPPIIDSHATATATLQQASDALVIRDVKLPKGWSRQADGRTLCPACSEKLALARLTKLEVPKPDPERAKMVKAIDKGDNIGSDFLRRTREELQTEPVLDVRAHPGGASGEVLIQAWRDGRLLIQSTQDDSVKLDLRHQNFKLVTKPPFMDESLTRVVEGLLATVLVDRGDEVPKGMVVLPLDDSDPDALCAMHEGISKRVIPRDPDMNSGLTNADMETIVRNHISELGEALKVFPLHTRTRAIGQLVTHVTEGDPDADILRKSMSDPAALRALAEAVMKKEQS